MNTQAGRGRINCTFGKVAAVGGLLYVEEHGLGEGLSHESRRMRAALYCKSMQATVPNVPLHPVYISLVAASKPRKFPQLVSRQGHPSPKLSRDVLAEVGVSSMR